MTGDWKSIAVAVALVCAGATASAQDKAKVDQGVALFTSQKCSMCHAVAGKGNAKGALDGVGAKLSEADIRAWLTDPEGMRTKTSATRTPVMKKAPLNPGQVDALTAYLLSLKK
jgi:mono/diheme cytochrome c family protein